MNRPAAFALQASLTVGFLAGASAPTPLYPLYQARWGFSSLAVTEIFGIYALAVLVALLVFGRLSDHVGRRPVLRVATAVQALAMLLFVTADGLGALLVARVVQGLAAGSALAAIGAGLVDLNPRQGALANAITPPLGTAMGGLIGGLVVSLLPSPTHTVFLLFGTLFIVQLVALLFLGESVVPRAGALASLKPQFRFSAATRGPLLRAAPAIIAAWAVAGFFASLGPTMVRSLLGSDSPLLSGLVVFVLAGSGGAAVLLLQREAPDRSMRLGALTLLAGILTVTAGLVQQLPALFLAGSIVAGLGFGAGFQGAVRSVVGTVAPGERAGVLSVVFVLAYLAMGLPALGAGYLLVRGGDLIGTVREFTALIVVLSLMSLFGTRAPAAPRARPRFLPHHSKIPGVAS